MTITLLTDALAPVTVTLSTISPADWSHTLGALGWEL